MHLSLILSVQYRTATSLDAATDFTLDPAESNWYLNSIPANAPAHEERWKLMEIGKPLLGMMSDLDLQCHLPVEVL